MFLILLRCFHATPELLARRRNHDEPVGLKIRPKGKFRKKDRKPPIEALYVAPELKRNTKSLQDKTLDVFGGITIVELAKRTGESIATLQDIIVNIGEKPGSEFDPLSIDVAELVGMVFFFLSCKTCFMLLNTSLKMTEKWKCSFYIQFSIFYLKANLCATICCQRS